MALPYKKDMPPKSIWRQPNAVHFQVVHRSHRDALYNDPDAGPHVLKPVGRQGKGKTRADIVNDDPALARNDRKNIGEAALYGVYFDDTEYDYMQHLRSINDDENSRRGGVDEDPDTDTVWIPSAVQPSERQKGFALRDDDDEKEHEKQPSLMLPASAFPSKEVAPSDAMHFDVDPALQGLNPDMDPHLRQTLEALEDDAFVNDDADDDFFGEVVDSGVWDGVRTADDEWRDAAPEGDDIWLDPVQRALRERETLRATGGDEAAETQLSLTARVALFKEQQKNQAPASDDSDEDRDELGELPAPRAAMPRRAGSTSSSGSALGKKGKPGALARRAASSRAGSVGGGSVWSMSSSAMARNQGLTDLDERFDQVIREYGGKATGDPEIDAQTGAFDEIAEPKEEDEEEELDEETVERLTRGDFDAIMDEFLDTQEVIGGKLKQRLGTRDATPNEKLSLVREALGSAHIVDGGEDMSTPAEENPFLNPRIIGADREQWDVETIRTTKTNLENHPRTITAASTSATPRAIDNDVRIPKIRIHPRTGMPQVVGYTVAQKDRKRLEAHKDDAPASEDADTPDKTPDEPARPAVPSARSRNESAEERRARKSAVKGAKQQRKSEKSANKKAFASERKRQDYAGQRQAESVGGAPALHLS